MSERKQDEILSNFDSFLKIAGSELGFLRNVAKNITQSGKEVNLWEVLTAVNETVRKNPDSSIAQLMTKFEVREWLCLIQLDTLNTLQHSLLDILTKFNFHNLKYQENVIEIAEKNCKYFNINTTACVRIFTSVEHMTLDPPTNQTSWVILVGDIVIMFLTPHE